MGRPPQAPEDQTEGLVLTAGGVARPPIKERRNLQPARADLRSRARDGSRKAETSGSVYNSPARRGRLYRKKTISTNLSVFTEKGLLDACLIIAWRINVLKNNDLTICKPRQVLEEAFVDIGRT